MTEAEYLTERVGKQIDWYDGKSRWYKRFTLILRIIEVVAASGVTFTGTVAKSYPSGSLWIASGLGIIIIMCTSLASLFHGQEHWLEYRTTAESLKKEKFLFETRVEPYHGDNAFALLVQRVETLVSKENTNWAQYMMQPGKAQHGR